MKLCHLSGPQTCRMTQVDTVFFHLDFQPPAFTHLSSFVKTFPFSPTIRDSSCLFKPPEISVALFSLSSLIHHPSLSVHLVVLHLSSFQFIIFIKHRQLSTPSGKVSPQLNMSASGTHGLDEDAAAQDFGKWHSALTQGRAQGKPDDSIPASFPSVIVLSDNEFLCSWQGTEAGIKLRTITSQILGFNSNIELGFCIRYQASPGDTKLTESKASVFLTAQHILQVEFGRVTVASAASMESGTSRPQYPEAFLLTDVNRSTRRC